MRDMQREADARARVRAAKEAARRRKVLRRKTNAVVRIGRFLGFMKKKRRDSVAAAELEAAAAEAEAAAAEVPPAAPAPAPETALAIGALVEARFDGADEWYPGAVTAAHADGTFDIAYDDGDDETAVPLGYVRARAD